MADAERKDVIQATMGNFGRWQLWICLSLSVLKIPVAWHQLGIVFLAPPVSFWCSDASQNASREHHCETLNGSQCGRWEYDRSVFTETIITEWNLVCDRAQLANVAQTTFMLGVLLGNVLFGMAADRIGRKLPLVVAVVLQVVSGVAAAFVPWFEFFLVLRFVSALATGGTMITSFVLCMEILGGTWRLVVATLYHIPFSLGHSSLAGIAYYARDWQTFQLAISLPSVILISYWWLVPESPRWLLAVGRHEEAAKILSQAVKRNRIDGVDVNQTLQTVISQKAKERAAGPERKANILDLFRTPNMRTKTICIYYNWLVCGLCFFGLAQYMGQVGGDIFMNVAISGLIEIPGVLFCIYCMNRFGRRNTMLSGQLLASVACFAIIAVPNGPDQPEWPKVMLAALGIVGMSTSFPTVYLFSGELFPTVVRNVGVGSASMCARIGSMVAPFVSSLNAVGFYLPPLVFGGVPLLGALLALLLPETAHCELPDTLEEGENFGKKPKKTKQELRGRSNNGYCSDVPL